MLENKLIKEEIILLYFGYIRSYKGLDVLIESVRILKKKLNNFKVLAVGDCYEDPNKYINLIKKNKIENIFDLCFEFIPDNKVSTYFSAADLMLGHSCFMANRLGCVTDDMPHIREYVSKISSRPAFKKAIELK